MSSITKKKIVGLREFRENTEDFIRALRRGREYTIVRKGSPVFKITPVDEWDDEDDLETVWSASRDNGGKGIEDNDFIKMPDEVIDSK